MDSPKIDVLIPALNAGKTIETAIKSIQDQTSPAIRIVIVDDGSTGGTRSILVGLANDDKRIEILARPNRGIVAALNFGLDHCRLEFLALHDGDDLASPDRFDKLGLDLVGRFTRRSDSERRDRTTGCRPIRHAWPSAAPPGISTRRGGRSAASSISIRRNEPIHSQCLPEVAGNRDDA